MILFKNGEFDIISFYTIKIVIHLPDLKMNFLANEDKSFVSGMVKLFC